MKIIAFLTEADSIQRLLTHMGEPATPPRIAPARLPVRCTQTGAPPDWLEADFDQTPLNESEEAEPIPEFDKSAGKPICTAESRPQGGAQGAAP